MYILPICLVTRFLEPAEGGVVSLLLLLLLPEWNTVRISVEVLSPLDVTCKKHNHIIYAVFGKSSTVYFDRIRKIGMNCKSSFKVKAEIICLIFLIIFVKS
jgi:hypothetical protein